QLVQKAKATCQELKVGDIVLIELENKKRVMWPMGKVRKSTAVERWCVQGSTGENE
ncbi:hypothetical protein CEXT_338521, partial [Caerostris extrusa]